MSRGFNGGFNEKNRTWVSDSRLREKETNIFPEESVLIFTTAMVKRVLKLTPGSQELLIIIEVNIDVIVKEGQNRNGYPRMEKSGTK